MIKNVFIIFLFLLSLVVQARQVVKVGGYEFPPFVIVKNNIPTGMTLDLIETINQSQSNYKFEFVLTTAKNRYRDFNSKKYDMIFFENIIWGWQEEPIQPSQVILNGGEVFIARVEKGRDQSFFDSLKGKTIYGINGFHYKFANFVSNKGYLEKYFGMKLGNSHEENIMSVLKSDTESMAIVTESFLNLFLNKNPELRERILQSKKFDQIYRHTILLRKDVSPSLNELNSLITKMKSEGILNQIWKKYGIEK
ncbi:putative exported protein [Halobacteriovorax marinus SJ]|uniref:Exported protein n=1 Tax=Halobacteriovorax marinus (strain ATCC BAA-682 / DSM 15412 / SJ) TaxID=862908 RepID=E1WYB8_HALMS|nr:transporter substrate-binding domain-containing protein [Halobacteriovorax marinus]CBW25966.1 putative exported protein [Halobacteriovorax marinus SJ]